MALMQCAAIITFVHVYKIIAMVSCLFVYVNVQFPIRHSMPEIWPFPYYGISISLLLSISFILSFHSDTIYKQTHTHTVL